jgi:hypothetical protein
MSERKMLVFTVGGNTSLKERFLNAYGQLTNENRIFVDFKRGRKAENNTAMPKTKESVINILNDFLEDIHQESNAEKKVILA